MITTIIFDLDNCLCAADEAGTRLLAPVAEAVRNTNNGRLPDAILERALADCWRLPFDWVASTYGFPEDMRSAAWSAYTRLEVEGPLRGYRDLHLMRELPVRRFLVTSGFRRLQQSKIRALGLEPCFTSVHIDAIDEPGIRGKRPIFEEILQLHALRPDEVLVVGDSPESEIAAGNSLGLATVQILRPGVRRSEDASHHVHGLAELERLLGSAG